MNHMITETHMTSLNRAWTPYSTTGWLNGRKSIGRCGGLQEQRIWHIGEGRQGQRKLEQRIGYLPV